MPDLPWENDDETWDPDDELDDCWHCAGEAWVECDDPLQCTQPHIEHDYGQLCPCSSCNGSGKRKDMTIW